MPHPLIRRRQTRYQAPFVLAHRPSLLLFALGAPPPIFSLFCRSFALCCRFGTTGESFQTRLSGAGGLTRLCRPGRLDLVTGGTRGAGRSSFPRRSCAMALELAFPSPPFDQGLALGQGRPRWGLLRCLVRGGRCSCCCCSSCLVARRAEDVPSFLLLSGACVARGDALRTVWVRALLRPWRRARWRSRFTLDDFFGGC